MTLFMTEFFSDKGVRARCVCETLNGAKVMVNVWRRTEDRRAQITMLTGFYQSTAADDIRFIPMCKQIIENIRFEVEKS